MENLREMLADYSDEQLVDEYNKRFDDYTEEAQKVLNEEIAKRGINPQAAQESKSSQAAEIERVLAPGSRIGREDFVTLNLVFAKTDVLTVNAMLRDSKVPYFVKESGENLETYNVCVYKDAVKEADAIIEEHFKKDEEAGRYVLRDNDIINRLKSFSFYDITLSPVAANEKLETSLSEQESAALLTLAQAIIEDADAIEEKQERVVFFYDSMEPLISKLQGEGGFTRTDFLAILELCQIYCEDERYDTVLNQTVSSILAFFLE
ncbi:MAG: hypothetical protein FWE57_01430 [Chitinispirillia bacterium]|nr:hypothetical protein [Chitinispirillia bacterium]